MIHVSTNDEGMSIDIRGSKREILKELTMLLNHINEKDKTMLGKSIYLLEMINKKERKPN